ncbi:chromate transporter [Methylocella sp.]|uniref:chromate transporter n=1 Tax=Methylocella sp. TaxID=1978226 RepID=UPI0037830C02
MNFGLNFAVLSVFSLLSVLAVGGGAAVLPEMKTLIVEQRHWLTESEFRDVFGLGQMAPGPNMLMVLVIGYRVSGLFGALLAFVGFFLPASVIAFCASRLWDRFEGSPWRAALQKGMAPLVVGLMAAGVVSIGRTAVTDATQAALASATCAAMLLLTRVNPALFVLAGGVICVLLRP